MTLPLPHLADRSFNDLMNELKALIPRYNRTWTNHNPSDPGIMLLELFAWLGEGVLYRTNKIPEKNILKFLELAEIELEEGETLDDGIRRALELVSHRYRAITKEDYEQLAQEAMAEKGLGGKAICLPNRDLDFSAPSLETPGHVSVLLIPSCDSPNAYCADNKPTQALGDFVSGILDERRLLTTRVHVAPFQNVGLQLYKKIRLEGWIVSKRNVNESDIQDEAADRIKNYLDPLTGGADGDGWPLGRDLYRSEIYQLLEGVTGVDHVFKLSMKEKAAGSSIFIEKETIILEAHQLFEWDTSVDNPKINVIRGAEFGGI